MAYRSWLWRLPVRNGQIPRERLAPISPPQYDADLGGPAILHPEAAAAMSALLTAARAARHSVGVIYSYRTLAKQWEKYRNYQAGGNIAATPGTSNHGWAVSCDMRWGTSAAQAWLRNNAPRYGFVDDVFRSIGKENWHYTYQGGWEGEVDDMTPEQKKRLREALAAANEADRKVDQILDGMTRFLQDAPEPPRDGIVKRTWRAFTKAAR